MRMVLNGPLPVEIDDLLARRRALGQDTFDEVWNGEYHMNPAPNLPHASIEAQLNALLYQPARGAGLYPVGQFNLGTETDYRVPDGGFLRHSPSGVRTDDAAIVVEIVSPGDESYAKFDHFAAYGVIEVIIVDPERRTVEIFTRAAGLSEFASSGVSSLRGITADTLRHGLDWP